MRSGRVARLGIGFSAGRLASASPRLSAVDRARTEERSLLRTWVMRGPCLIAAEDAAWLAPLFEQAFADNRQAARPARVDPATQEREARSGGRSRDGPPSRETLWSTFVAKIVLDPSTRLHLFRLAIARGSPAWGRTLGPRPTSSRGDWLGERLHRRGLLGGSPASGPSGPRPRRTSRGGPALACGRSARRSPGSAAS
jgi:hypothetical protein